MAWIQGTNGQSFDNNPINLTLSVNSGDALVVSVGVWAGGVFFGTLEGISITDTQNSVWQLVACSPIQSDSEVNSYQLYTFVALNCPSGSTTVTVHNNGLYNVAAIDEYSNVASVRALDDVNFNSTPLNQSPAVTLIDSGYVSINGTELVYSSTFSDASSQTFTPSLGFNSRQYVTNPPGGGALQSFDQIVTGGAINNVTSITLSTDTLHTNIIALSPTPVNKLVLQSGYAAGSSISGGTSIDISLPFDTTAGNLLIFCHFAHERGDFSAVDTQGNTWTVFQNPNTTGPTNIMGYAITQSSAPLTVTISSGSGGDDVTLLVSLHEYNVQKATFSSFSFGQNGSANSLSTGFVTATDNSLLISSVTSGLQYTKSFNKCISGYGSPFVESNWRYQISDGGFFNESPCTLVLADQQISIAGNYENVFMPNVGPNSLAATILGFNFIPLVITADNQFKQLGDEFIFDGTEFTEVGLLLGDSITSCDITSPGAPADAPVGTYPIFISGAVGTGLDKYIITYVDGVMVVAAGCFLVDFPLMGPFYTPEGFPLANGTLSVRLVFDCNCPCADYQITGSNHSILSLDSNGVVTGHPRIRPNDQLKPDGSYYILQAYSENGQLVLGPKVLKVFSF